MKANFAHRSIFAFILAVLIDQAHKLYMINVVGWKGGEGVVVTPFFDYVLVWNRGHFIRSFLRAAAIGTHRHYDGRSTWLGRLVGHISQ